MNNLTLEELKIKRDCLQLEIEEIGEQINKKLSQTLVRCESNNYGSGCKMGYEIKELTYIQTHWYEEPYSCNGGDIWHAGEGNFICPNCGHRNRLYNRKEIEKLRPLFKNIVEFYEK